MEAAAALGILFRGVSLAACRTNTKAKNLSHSYDYVYCCELKRTVVENKDLRRKSDRLLVPVNP